MKNKPDKNKHDQFMAFMDGMDICFNELPFGAYQQAMQDAITQKNGWNDQNGDNINGYEGVKYWLKHLSEWRLSEK